MLEKTNHSVTTPDRTRSSYPYPAVRAAFSAGFFAAALLPALILLCFTNAVALRHERLIDSWKPLNYNVSLTFNDQLSEITSAKVEITILSLKDTLSQVDLDFGAMPVDSVTINGQAVRHERSRDLLNIKLPKATRK